MYGVKFSLWLTGAVGPQAVAGRHSSTWPFAGGGPTVQVLENSKTWLSIIFCSLMLWIDLWCFF